MYDAIHIGQRKCASTYLQRVGLSSHPEIDLVWDDHKRLFFDLVDFGFDFDIVAFRQAIKKSPLRNSKPGATKRVFSHDTLCGGPTAADARLNADLCYRAFGRIKTLMIIREPYSMLYSFWDYYVQVGGVLSLHDYLNSRASPVRPTFLHRDNIWKRVQHYQLIRYWMSLVGEDRFGVFLLEDLSTDFDAFHSNIYDFIGVDATYRPSKRRDRPGYPYAVAQLKRFTNRYTKTAANPAGLLPSSAHSEIRLRFNQLAKRWPTGGRPDVRALVPANVRDDIRPANRMLADMLDRDLGALGYDV